MGGFLIILLYFLFLLIYSFVVSDIKKKKYKVFAQMADACRRMNYVDKVKVTSVMLFKDVVMKQGVVNAFQSILSKLGY